MAICDIDPATNAFWIANQMESKRYEYVLHSDDLVIDLGAHDGTFAQAIHNKYGCSVVCVEPTGAADYLDMMPWCAVIRAAASTDTISRKFGGNSYYTTIMEPGETVYPCFDVLDLMKDPIGLMKINVEGFEYMLMDRIIAAGKQSEVKYFQIQFHMLNEQSKERRKDIQKALSKTHKQMWNVDFCWESWERVEIIL